MATKKTTKAATAKKMEKAQANKVAAVRALPQADVLAELSKRTGLSQKDCKAVLTEYVDFATLLLRTGGKIGLPNFGNFELRSRPARTGRNPQTGAEIEIKASNTVGFKPGKALKEAL